jgi:hypothetical protein
MKKVIFTLAIFAFLGFSVSSQDQLSFQFSNLTVLPGNPDVVQFNIDIKADNPGSFHRDLQIYLDYNSLAFGENIVSNAKINISPLDLMSAHYATVNLVDNSASKIAFISEANEELNQAGSSLYFTEVPVSYTGFIQVQIEIADASQVAGISFDENLMNGGQYMQSTSSTNPLGYANPNLYGNDLENISFIAHELNMEEGWSGISSYMLPYDADVENMFSQIGDELVVLKDLLHVYYPQYNVNTINNWNENSGYMVKVTQNTSLRIFGSGVDGAELSLNSGWNLIPVKSNCDVSTTDLLSNIPSSELVIIRDAVGTGVYWPAQNINSLPYLIPGKSYFIKVLSDQIITFPSCVK